MVQKEDYYSEVINLLDKNGFYAKTLERLSNYSTVKVSFNKYDYFLIIWHKKISQKKDYLDLYNAIQNYTPKDNRFHNKEYCSDHIIICKSLEIDESDKIEEFEKKTKKHLKYYHCEKNWIIKMIIVYFSYQYAIFKNISKTEFVVAKMRESCKNITGFEDLFQKYVAEYELSIVINILTTNDYRYTVVKTGNTQKNYTIVKVSYSSYFFYLFLWHKKVVTLQDYTELYNAVNINYVPPKNPTHTESVKYFCKDDHIIVCEESCNSDGDIIEGYMNSKTIKLPLPYNYCNENWIIYHIVEYFSYQYVISKKMSIHDTDSFANYMAENVKKFSCFEEYCKKI
ncbi:12673_t:CDS:1 [Dentiscutata erythropus]|uniref:12673_t:CDS:1 n=1 Tax=Dentiscutata erythropus TaxID=1348616 RepID=A0A9N9EPZ7_9GLOM|nr:12673_t:CDS:1 [Dentiscutata erythropus]